jgi:inner membrane protein
MASLGHVALGMAAARIHDHRRPPASSMAFWSALSLFPDIDVVGFRLAVDYGDPWGHRGATHSLVFAVALGVTVGLAARGFSRPAARTAIVATAVLASHGLLDTMTDGGLGCALLWPFELTRYFAPLRPIPVAPIGLGMLSAYGLIVVLVELAMFTPALLFALRPPTLATRRVVSWLAVWAIALPIVGYSPARDGIVEFLLRDGTRLTPGFSEAAFRNIAVGDSENDVRRRLGEPFSESWFYVADARSPEDRPIPSEHTCGLVRFERGAVSRLFDPDACGERGVRIGLPDRDVETRLGKPHESCWQYSQPSGTAAFRQRAVCFSSGVVRRIVRR